MEKDSVVVKFATTAADGKTYNVDYYNLDVIISVVSGYFDLAEINAIEHKPMHMEDYIEQLDLVLTSGNRKLLEDAGSVSHRQAIDKAKREYRKYHTEELTPVENSYLEVLKKISKDIKKK